MTAEALVAAVLDRRYPSQVTVRRAPRIPALALAAGLAASLSACGGGGDAKEPTAPTAPIAAVKAIVDSIRVAWTCPRWGLPS